ncbi:hypothetical protein EYF80_051739 [Liparis tanakae]|uniref:Uncharacterized protein n=1 Tax=Liparis tanakae TaxID=230148 RepID=A0A4Z2FAC5_9TELE|nr:hypothetical protein EYF80_051739 [Liparis tanakae]
MSVRYHYAHKDSEFSGSNVEVFGGSLGDPCAERRASQHSPDCAALDRSPSKVKRRQARNFIFEKGCVSW